MSENRVSTRLQIAFVIAFAAFGGFSLWYWGPPDAEHIQERVEQQRAREFAERVADELDDSTAEALAYIDALIACECEAVVSRTNWMQERIARLRDEGAAEADVAAAIEAFCEALCERDEAGFRVAQEGVDDQFLFFPGVEVRFVGKDAGRDDLALPAVSRAWIEVSFPSPTRCLVDDSGRAIQAVIVGLNVSEQGRILKAGVLGNAEIQWDSFRYSW